MTGATSRTRRGLTLLELMLALAITTMVGAAIAGMMDAVTSGVLAHQDLRESMVRANTAQIRLDAYVAPSRCVLDAGATKLVIWRDDSRASGTVHATEIRWLYLDAGTGTLVVDYVRFPDGWAEAAKALEDDEYDAATADWEAIRNDYRFNGWMWSLTLVDGLDGVQVKLDDPQATESRHVLLDLSISTSEGTVDARVSSTIRTHEPPEAGP